MDTNMTFRIDSQVKAQMAAICRAAGHIHIHRIQHFCKCLCPQ